MQESRAFTVPDELPSTSETQLTTPRGEKSKGLFSNFNIFGGASSIKKGLQATAQKVGSKANNKTIGNITFRGGADQHEYEDEQKQVIGTLQQ